jgi:hypothetical protein
MVTENQQKFIIQGNPGAVPSGKSRMCPVDSCKPSDNGGWAFCEIDWRWESKRHLAEKTHGLWKESEGRNEPIIQAKGQGPAG